MRKNPRDDCAVALGGHSKEDGKEAVPKQLGKEWCRWRETVPAGAVGTQNAVQPQTNNSGRATFEPCVPPGTKKIKIKIRMFVLPNE